MGMKLNMDKISKIMFNSIPETNNPKIVNMIKIIPIERDSMVPNIAKFLELKILFFLAN